jgi:hypothetical protein
MKDMHGPRHRIILPAPCWNPRRRDFHAITTDVSAEGVGFRSPSLLIPAEDLTGSIRHFGRLEVRIDLAVGQNFVATGRGGPPVLAGLARQFVTLSRAQDPDTAEPIRVHRRLVAKQWIVAVTLESGQAVSGDVLNISASGLALLLDETPELGALIRVGQKLARVRRHFTHGVGAAFLEPFEPSDVHEAMIL